MGKLGRPLSFSKHRTFWEVGGTFPIVFQVSYFLGVSRISTCFQFFRVGPGNFHVMRIAWGKTSGVNPLNSSLVLKISVAQCSRTLRTLKGIPTCTTWKQVTITSLSCFSVWAKLNESTPFSTCEILSPANTVTKELFVCVCVRLDPFNRSKTCSVSAGRHSISLGLCPVRRSSSDMDTGSDQSTISAF